MPKRAKLESLLKKVSDDEFNAIWHDAYGYLPEGSRSDLAKTFVAEQYDGELDGCIAVAQSLLTHTPPSKAKAKPNPWLPPR